MPVPATSCPTYQPVLYAADMKLTIEKIIYGGQGIATIPAEAGSQGGMRAFVPFTLPQEVVEAELAEERRGYCVGKLLDVVQPSEFRTTPACPWFGICGGCQLQHSEYAYQVQLKIQILTESLSRAGLKMIPEITSLAGSPFGYRNRVRLQVHSQPEFAIGYRHAKSHRMVSIDHCPIANSLLERCIATMRQLGLKNLVPAGLEEVEFFTNQDESALLATMWTQREKFNRDAYIELFRTLQKEISELSGGAVQAVAKENTVGTRPLLQWGRDSLRYEVAGRDYIVSLGSFFQINAEILDTFVEHVIGDEIGKLSWDLYAGVGLFSLALAERFQKVMAVESHPISAKDLRKNVEGKRAIAVASTTLEFLQNAGSQIAQGREPAPDFVLLDPPRAGAGIDVCRLLAECGAPRIVYVSCDPATLGRDLATLIQSGYRLHKLQMADMFPQTGHLETIATLTRS